MRHLVELDPVHVKNPEERHDSTSWHLRVKVSAETNTTPNGLQSTRQLISLDINDRAVLLTLEEWHIIKRTVDAELVKLGSVRT